MADGDPTPDHDHTGARSESRTPPTRVVLIEDHAVVAEAVEHVLGAERDLLVVGHAATLQAGTEAVADLRPDLTVMNVRLPDGDGASGTAEVLRACPTTRVVLLSAFGSIEVIARAIEAGAVGFIPKTAGLKELVVSLRRAAEGAIVLPPDLLSEVAAHIRTGATASETSLTTRERQVLQRLAEGDSATVIAERLGLSLHTVRNHLRAVRRKLGASTQVEAIAIAYRAGLVQPPLA